MSHSQKYRIFCSFCLFILEPDNQQSCSFLQCSQWAKKPILPIISMFPTLLIVNFGWKWKKKKKHTKNGYKYPKYCPKCKGKKGFWSSCLKVVQCNVPSQKDKPLNQQGTTISLSLPGKGHTPRREVSLKKGFISNIFQKSGPKIYLTNPM